LTSIHLKGNPSGYDISHILSLDPAVITDKIAKYTGQQFSEFELEEFERDGERTVILACDILQ